MVEKQSIDDKIEEKARFYYTCRFNNEENWKTVKECVILAIEDVLQLSKSQMCSVFGILYKDFQYDEYVEKITKRLNEKGVID